MAELVLADDMRLYVRSCNLWDDIHIHLEGDPSRATPEQAEVLKADFGHLVDVLTSRMIQTRFTMDPRRGEE